MTFGSLWTGVIVTQVVITVVFLATVVSLARTARLLTALERTDFEGPPVTLADDDYEPTREHTPWGDARRLCPPVTIRGTPIHWERAATALGSDAPTW